MIIRTETVHDIDAITTLTLAAFDNHPHHAPDQETNEHLIIERLRQVSDLTLSLVAQNEAGIVGHIAFSPITINGEDLSWLVLAPVSVLPKFQNQGIGSQMIRQALIMLAEKEINGVVVLGEPNYYARFGFHTHHELYAEGIPAEYLLAQTLHNNSPDKPAGLIKFHAAFS